MFANKLGTLTVNELETLCVPLGKCVSVNPGPVDRDILAELEACCYDQAPVFRPGVERPIGLVETKRLRELLDEGESLPPDDPEVCDEGHFYYIGSFMTVEQVLEKLSERRAALVIRGSSATEYGYHEWYFGLLTVSDLNRQPFRAALYSLLAELESSLAVFVESRFNDPWEWVRKLGEEHQVRLLGYWDLTKRRGIDVGPIAASTLTQMIKVVSLSKELLSDLGYRSKKDFDKQTGRIPELRNRVMHPVRPLVLDQKNLSKIRTMVESTKDLFARVKERIDPRQV